jgi:hypothetical protein
VGRKKFGDNRVLNAVEVRLENVDDPAKEDDALRRGNRQNEARVLLGALRPLHHRVDVLADNRQLLRLSGLDRRTSGRGIILNRRWSILRRRRGILRRRGNILRRRRNILRRETVWREQIFCKGGILGRKAIWRKKRRKVFRRRGRILGILETVLRRGIGFGRPGDRVVGQLVEAEDGECGNWEGDMEI